MSDHCAGALHVSLHEYDVKKGLQIVVVEDSKANIKAESSDLCIAILCSHVKAIFSIISGSAVNKERATSA